MRGQHASLNIASEGANDGGPHAEPEAGTCSARRGPTPPRQDLGRSPGRVRGWIQREAAEAWNARWPDEPKTFKNFSYWEVWPSGTGHAPSLDTLARLAELYECSEIGRAS